LLNKIKIYIISKYQEYKYAQIILITFTSKLRHQIKGLSEFYTGIINIKGLGYSVNVTVKKNKYNLFFRFGFKDTYNYIMPSTINIENAETAKIHLIISTYSLELLKEVQRNIQRFRYPKAYKLQGIYLNNIFPKVKKYIK
jgi:ribosomal protein L6P/L9E